jgi:signal transduction histidine kinase
VANQDTAVRSVLPCQLNLRASQTGINRALLAQKSQLMQNTSPIKTVLIADTPGQVEKHLLELQQDSTRVQQGKPAYQLVRCNTLADGLAYLKAHICDLVLLDLSFSGYEVLAWLTAVLDCVPMVPIIIVTNLEDDQLRCELINAGAQDYLDKQHLSNHVLEQSICFAVKRHRHRQELIHKAEELTVSKNYLQTLLEQTTERLAKEHTLLAQRVEERTTELSQTNLQLTQALRVKDEFLTSMSHELRTPLNAILGMSEILREGVYGTLNEQQLNSVSIVQESGRHLLALINDILDVSRIEADKLQLHLTLVPVQPVCEASLRFVQSAAQKKNITISVQIDLEDAVVQADERRLKQILVNLLTNAVKFTPNNGKIGLIISTHQADQQIRFSVWDTGIGISQADIDRIFEPFVQLDSRLSRQYEGTGLGLALVYLLTEMHGGKITVESKLGRGSQFTVSLPWQEDQPQPHHPSSPPADPEAQEPLNLAVDPPLILLAEDNLPNVEVMSSYLSAKGYRIITANDGAEAVKYAKKLYPDLILMDVHMPEMDGLEAIKIIRNISALSNTPIIALTALAMPGDKERCLAAGANDYLSKPVSLRSLTIAIENNLHVRPSLDESL